MIIPIVEELAAALIGVIVLAVIIILVVKQLKLNIDTEGSEVKIDNEIRDIFNKKGYDVVGIANPSAREIKEESPFDTSIHVGPPGLFLHGEKRFFRKVFYKRSKAEIIEKGWVKVIQSIYEKNKYTIELNRDGKD